MIYFHQKLSALYGQLEELFETPELYSAMFQVNREEAQGELREFVFMKDRASLGNRQAREYVINQYTKALDQGIKLSDQELQEIIPWEDWEKCNDRILFEILLDTYDMGELIDRYSLEVKFDHGRLREIFQMEGTKLRRIYQQRLKRLRILATVIYAWEDGQDVIDTLQHHNINEIGVLAKDYIYIVYRGKKLWLSFLSFPSDEVLINIQKKLTRNSKVQYDEQNPTVVASKENASRITVAGFVATPGKGDLFLNERIFNLKKITLEEMRDQYGTINQTIYQLILFNQRGRGSYLVSGSDMGVGKSTFLAATIEKVPDYWGIGLLDTQDELQLRKKYPWKNINTLIENPKRTIGEQFQIMLKMARDVLYVGEITKPEEIAQLIHSCLRLNAGVGGTIHLASPFEAVASCRNLLMSTEMYDNSDKAEEDIARGIDLIFHLGKGKDGKIVVEQVVELCYQERHLDLPVTLSGDRRERIDHLLNLAQLALRKYLYPRPYVYREIIRYDREREGWQILNPLSDQYYQKLSRFIPWQELSVLKELIQPREEGC